MKVSLVRRTARAFRLCLIAVAAAATLTVPSAQAAPLTVVAEPYAKFPNLDVDSAGNAHVVWVTGTGATNNLRYCTVRPTAGACDPATVKTLGQVYIGGPSTHVFVTPAGKIVVYANVGTSDPIGNQGWAWQSSDGGATFTQGAQITPTVPHTRDLKDAALGPGDALSVLNELPGSGGKPLYVRGPLAGPAGGAADLSAKLTNNFMSSTDGEQVGVLGDKPVAISLDSGHLEYAYNNGGDPNDANTWVGPVEVHPKGTDLGLHAMLAGGPKGLMLVYEVNSVSGSNDTFVGRLFDPATMQLRGPVAFGLHGDPVLKDVYASPSSGSFHSVYLADGKLRWARSANGASWTPQVVDTYSSGYYHQIAVGQDGKGLVIWQDQTGGASNYSIKAFRLIPSAGTATGTDACQPPGCETVGGTRASTRSVGDKQLTTEVEIPSCQNRKVTARVKIKKRSKSGGVTVTVTKVVFRLDKQKPKTDKKAPYRVTFSLAQALPKSLHKMTAKVHYTAKKKGGKPQKKTLTLTKRFRLCPLG